MRFDGPDRWVVLRVVSKDDGTFEYRDDRHVSIAFSLSDDLALNKVDNALRETFALLASVNVYPPRVLPLFAEHGDDPRQFEPVMTRLEKALPALERPERWQLLHAIAPPAWYGRYTLPLDVVTIGNVAEASLAAFRRHGFFLEAALAGSLSVIHLAPGSDLEELDPDIVIAGAVDAERILKTSRPGRGPRLVVTLADSSDWPGDSIRHWAHGAAVLVLPPPLGSPEVIDDVLMAIVHDMPLHEWLAKRSGGGRSPALGLLIADPFTNDGLRMSDAFAAEARQELETAIGVPTAAPWSDEAEPARPAAERASASPAAWPAPMETYPGDAGSPGGGFTEWVRTDRNDRETYDFPDVDFDVDDSDGGDFDGDDGEGGTYHSTITPRARQTLDLDFNFDREVSGLVPLSLARQQRAAAATFEDALPAPLGDLSEQRRCVDARIERVERVDDIDRRAPAAQALWVGRDRTLRRAARYRLRVQIGKSFAGNLIPDEIADLLLPPSPEAFWDLDVVVFAKDFALASPPLQRLRLPKSGASEALYFELTAPAAGDRAQLRFGIYLGNQLLQSFILDASLDLIERQQTDGLKVTLDFARSDAFANLDSLRPRAASIGVNLDATPDHHTLLVKVGDAVEGIPLTGTALDAPVRKLRGVLSAAAANGNDAVFPAKVQPLTPAQRARFEEVVRSLAAIGGELHDALFIRASVDMKKTLRQIMKSVDQPILLPRLDPNLAIPWAVVYDFVVPPGMPAVCDGTANGNPCLHGPGADVICVNGFWGIRHVLDEQLPLGRRDAVPIIARPAQGSTVRTSDGVGGTFCSDMIGRLNATFGKDALGNDTVTAVAATDDVVEILWNQRPAIMLILGHLDEASPPTIPRRRIKTAGRSAWLVDHDIIDRNKIDGDWEQPNTLVLLMACGAMQMTSTTLTDHALAISSAGAALVIGPECPIFPAFACWFTEELILSLLQERTSAGRALSEFRRRLVYAGNPLGFGFTAFGDADVTIA